MSPNRQFNQINKDLQKLKSSQKAKIYKRFFKAKKGEYGEGDIFIGLTVPKLRAIARKYSNTNLVVIKRLLENKIHEYRMTALLILVNKYQKSDEFKKKEIVDYFLKHTKYINNWDLVDLSADKILGDYLLNKDKKILYKLARSKNIWERRIAIIATFNFVKNNKFSDTLKISEMLISDSHDLVHKAVGWMLREVGKRNPEVLEKFLQNYHQQMPRIMLRYAIERFTEEKREHYLRKPINNFA